MSLNRYFKWYLCPFCKNEWRKDESRETFCEDCGTHESLMIVAMKNKNGEVDQAATMRYLAGSTNHAGIGVLDSHWRGGAAVCSYPQSGCPSHSADNNWCGCCGMPKSWHGKDANDN